MFGAGSATAPDRYRFENGRIVSLVQRVVSAYFVGVISDPGTNDENISSFENISSANLSARGTSPKQTGRAAATGKVGTNHRQYVYILQCATLR